MNEEAKKFEETMKDGDDLAILVRWIGWDVELERTQRPFLRDAPDGKGKVPKLPVDGPSEPFHVGSNVFKRYKFGRYGLTCKGEAVNVDQYCLRLASYAKTHVYLFQNWDKFNQICDADLDWTKSFNELKLEDRSGLGRFCSFHCYAPYLEK